MPTTPVSSRFKGTWAVVSFQPSELFLATSGSRRWDAAAAAAATVWLAVYAWRAVTRYYSLDVNAFDLSVFDHALWSLAHGGNGFVPFIGFSIFSHHFIPILWVLAPAYRIFESPVFLIVLQLAVTGVSGLIFYRLAQRAGLKPWAAFLLFLVFLLSRRTHGAAAGAFYPECLQTLFTLAMLMTWAQGGWRFWCAALLMLLTKEDAGIYVASMAFAALLSGDKRRQQALAAAAIAIGWVCVSLAIAIPMSRRLDGLSASNPIVSGRFAEPDGTIGPTYLVERLFSIRSLSTVGSLLGSVGGLCLFAPGIAIPAIPGVVANLAADPASMQSNLTNHYFWPILPWLMTSAAVGLVRLNRRVERLATGIVICLLVVTVIDNPAVRRVWSTRSRPEGSVVRQQLQGLSGRAVLATNNLIPQLPHWREIYAVDGDLKPPMLPDLVLLYGAGDMWPLTQTQVEAVIRSYEDDTRYEEVRRGPLYAFRLLSQ